MKSALLGSYSFPPPHCPSSNANPIPPITTLSVRYEVPTASYNLGNDGFPRRGMEVNIRAGKESDAGKVQLSLSRVHFNSHGLQVLHCCSSPVRISNSIFMRLRTREHVIPQCLGLHWWPDRWTTRLHDFTTSFTGTSPSILTRIKLLLLGVPHAQLLHWLRIF